MDWIRILYSDVIPWLLECSAPSIRYWTLTRLLDRGADDPDVKEARQAIMAHGPAVEILSHYAGDGRWKDEKSYYARKYRSTHWQLLLLAELAANGRDERIADACRRMVEEIRPEGCGTAWPCFYGNAVGYLHALGHAADEGVRAIETALIEAGTALKWQCSNNDGLPCAWGAARALWGFGRIPAGRRSDGMNEAIESGVRLLGRFKLREGNYPTGGSPHKLWGQLSFPLFYQADVLYTLRALTDVERLVAKPTFGKAVKWLEAQCRDDGRWDGASPYGSQAWGPLEKRRRPSKWVTWQALYVVKNAHLPSHAGEIIPMA